MRGPLLSSMSNAMPMAGKGVRMSLQECFECTCVDMCACYCACMCVYLCVCVRVCACVCVRIRVSCSGVRYGMVWFGMVRFEQTIYTVKHGTVEKAGNCLLFAAKDHIGFFSKKKML